MPKLLDTKGSPVEFVGFPVEIDVKAVTDEGEFEGYASTFGNRDLVGDVVMPGAFKKSIQKRGGPGNIALLWQHDTSQPIGVWTAMREDDTGLLAKGRFLTRTRGGSDAYEFVKAGAVKGLSIGFRAESWEYDKAGGTRMLKAVDLLEVSVVTMPANPKATVSAVKATELTERQMEKALRDAGFTRAERHKFVSAVKHLLRDAEDERPDALRDAEDAQAIAQGFAELATLFRS